jgi:head-tail adaptor
MIRRGTTQAYRAGARDRQVTIQQWTADMAGSTGYPVESWSTLGTEWMCRTDASAIERFASNQESAAAMTIWTMRFRADMDPEQHNVAKTRRLVYAGRTYDITAASHINRREGIELITQAKVG